mgnify:CR=1 FL=1
MSNFFMFNPTKANDLARFQGTLTGTMAGNARVTGTATAPTEAFNQAGYYAFQDADTGIFQLKKLQENSLNTNEWYSQSLDNTFSFKNNSSTASDMLSSYISSNFFCV